MLSTFDTSWASSSSSSSGVPAFHFHPTEPIPLTWGWTWGGSWWINSPCLASPSFSEPQCPHSPPPQLETLLPRVSLHIHVLNIYTWIYIQHLYHTKSLRACSHKSVTIHRSKQSTYNYTCTCMYIYTIRIYIYIYILYSTPAPSMHERWPIFFFHVPPVLYRLQLKPLQRHPTFLTILVNIHVYICIKRYNYMDIYVYIYIIHMYIVCTRAEGRVQSPWIPINILLPVKLPYFVTWLKAYSCL